MKVLSDRKHKILYAVVDDYIKDASPITSGGVQKNHLKGISTATLRNELNALEAMGFLKQLHTSGGRVPTTDGYRYYVNNLVNSKKFDVSLLESVRTEIDERTNSLSEIVSKISKIINKAVNYPTVVLMDGYNNLVVQGIKVIQMVAGTSLALIQTSGGYLSNSIEVEATTKACDDASKYLTKKFIGKTIGEMIETIDEEEDGMLAEIAGFKMVVHNLIDAMKHLSQQKMLEVRHDGSADILSNSGAEETTKVLKLLDDEKELEKAMKIEGKDLEIEIASESVYEGTAMVKAPIFVGGKQIASVAVFGPQRMNYAGIASALKTIMNELKKEDTK